MMTLEVLILRSYKKRIFFFFNSLNRIKILHYSDCEVNTSLIKKLLFIFEKKNKLGKLQFPRNKKCVILALY